MLPQYLVFVLAGVGLGLVTSRFPDEPFWNKAAMFCLAIAAALVVYGVMVYIDTGNIPV